jgi:YbaB/EbfC DNA-binding family
MARILAKALNCAGTLGPTSDPDKSCHVCIAIANGTSLDVRSGSIRAIDSEDPELLADMVLAAVNEALRSAQSLMQSKVSGLIPGDIGDPAASSRGPSPDARVA